MPNVIVCPLADGGICHYTYGLAEALQRNGRDTTVVTNSAQPYDLDGIPHNHRLKRALGVGGNPFTRLLYPVSNTAAILREAAETPVIHFQWPTGPRNDVLQWKLLKASGKRIVYTAHDVVSNDFDDTVLAHARALYRKADALIVHGEKLKCDLIRIAGVPVERVHVLPLGNYNFIADTYGKWNRAAARESLGWTGDEFVALFFGFVRPYKGLDTLIAACGLVRQEVPEAAQRLRMLIVGANYRNFWDAGGYTQQISDAGMAAQTRSIVEYVRTEDIGRFFLTADAVVLPYKWGSQSAVMPLGYAYSRPVIATDVGSLREAMIPGETALLIPPDNPEAVAAALKSLFCDPDKAREIGRNGRKFAETALSWDRIAEAHLGVYETVGSRQS